MSRFAVILLALALFSLTSAAPAHFSAEDSSSEEDSGEVYGRVRADKGSIGVGAIGDGDFGVGSFSIGHGGENTGSGDGGHGGNYGTNSYGGSGGDKGSSNYGR